MSRFEDRLLSELLEQHGALLADAPARPLPAMPAARLRLRVPIPRLLPAGALGLAVAALVAALVIGLSSGGGGGGTPAYAVVRNGDGTVTVTVNELLGIEGANEELKTLGVPAVVVRSEEGCSTSPGQYKAAPVSAELSHQIASGSGSGGASSVVIDPAAIPEGDTVAIGVRALETPGEPAAGLEIGIYEGAAPPCLSAAGSD